MPGVLGVMLSIQRIRKKPGLGQRLAHPAGNIGEKNKSFSKAANYLPAEYPAFAGQFR